MAYISPRFVSPGAKTGKYRHPEEVPASFGPGLAGHAESGAVSFWLTLEDGARVNIRLNAEECARISKFSEDLLKKKPLGHEMSRRTYIVGGEHYAIVRGWWNGNTWEPDTQTPVECNTCALSYSTVQGLYTMARCSGVRWVLDGQIVEWRN